MRVLVPIEGHFIRYKEKVFSSHLTYERFWKRYLDSFQEVLVLARVLNAETVPNNWYRADGPGVVFQDLPEYRGFSQYLRILPRLRAQVKRAVQHADAAILRVPGQIGTLVWKELRKKKRPFGVEVVGDPWDVFAPGSFQSIARPLIRRLSTRNLRAQCREAVAAAYVTESALQRRYPPGGWNTHYSNVDLPPEAFISDQFLADRLHKLRDLAQNEQRPWRLVFVGGMNQLYKAPHVLLRAVAACVEDGLNLEVIMVGDGHYRPQLEAQAAQLGLANRVYFLGRLPSGTPVREQLDRSDLFVLPSFQEGLPRAMIEAMARGLPCIGSTVGGIPELLPPEDLVPSGNAEALARKIQEVVRDPDRMCQMAERNFQVARNYRPEVLQARREQFYRKVRELTEAWYAATIRR